MKLSERRAKSYDLLIASGIDASRLTTKVMVKISVDKDLPMPDS